MHLSIKGMSENEKFPNVARIFQRTICRHANNIWNSKWFILIQTSFCTCHTEFIYSQLLLEEPGTLRLQNQCSRMQNLWLLHCNYRGGDSVKGHEDRSPVLHSYVKISYPAILVNKFKIFFCSNILRLYYTLHIILIIILQMVVLTGQPWHVRKRTWILSRAIIRKDGQFLSTPTLTLTWRSQYSKLSRLRWVGQARTRDLGLQSLRSIP